MSKSTQAHIQLETTPRVYQKHYKAPDPCYDLYPSLLRRQSNGYAHSSNQNITISSKSDFITMNIPYVRRLSFIQDPFWGNEESQEFGLGPQWDLYPGVLRNIVNFGTDQMRQRLRRMESTMTLA